MSESLQAFADRLAGRAIMERYLFGREGGRKCKQGEVPGSFISKLSESDRERVRKLKPEHFKTALRKWEMHEGDIEESRRFVSSLLKKFDKEIMRKGYGKNIS